MKHGYRTRLRWTYAMHGANISNSDVWLWKKHEYRTIRERGWEREEYRRATWPSWSQETWNQVQGLTRFGSQLWSTFSGSDKLRRSAYRASPSEFPYTARGTTAATSTISKVAKKLLGDAMAGLRPLQSLASPVGERGSAESEISRVWAGLVEERRRGGEMGNRSLLSQWKWKTWTWKKDRPRERQRKAFSAFPGFSVVFPFSLFSHSVFFRSSCSSPRFIIIFPLHPIKIIIHIFIPVRLSR